MKNYYIGKAKEYFTDFHKMVNRVFNDKKISLLFSILIHTLIVSWMVLCFAGYTKEATIPMLILIITYAPVLVKLDKINKIERNKSDN